MLELVNTSNSFDHIHVCLLIMFSQVIWTHTYAVDFELKLHSLRLCSSIGLLSIYNPNKNSTPSYVIPHKTQPGSNENITIYILNPPPFLPRIFHLCPNLSLTPKSKPCLTDLTNTMKILINKIIFTKNMKN